VSLKKATNIYIFTFNQNQKFHKINFKKLAQQKERKDRHGVPVRHKVPLSLLVFIVESIPQKPEPNQVHKIRLCFSASA